MRLSIPRRVIGILAAAAALTLPLLAASPASAARASYPSCDLVFGSITIHVSEAVTISGHQSAGTVFLDSYAGRGQSGLETVDIVEDHVSGAYGWYGPGPTLNANSSVTRWSWGWDPTTEPVLTVSGMGSRGEERICSTHPS